MIFQNCPKFHSPNGSWNYVRQFLKYIYTCGIYAKYISLQIMLLPNNTNINQSSSKLVIFHNSKLRRINLQVLELNLRLACLNFWGLCLESSFTTCEYLQLWAYIIIVMSCINNYYCFVLLFFIFFSGLPEPKLSPIFDGLGTENGFYSSKAFLPIVSMASKAGQYWMCCFANAYNQRPVCDVTNLTETEMHTANRKNYYY